MGCLTWVVVLNLCGVLYPQRNTWCEQIPEHLTNRTLPEFIFPLSCGFPAKQWLASSCPDTISYYTAGLGLCYGKCYDDWMYRGDYCQACTLLAQPPVLKALYIVQRFINNTSCDQSQLETLQNTCGRCNECRDLQPNSGYSCAQHRDWGDCSKSWMKDGRLCEMPPKYVLPSFNTSGPIRSKPVPLSKAHACNQGMLSASCSTVVFTTKLPVPLLLLKIFASIHSRTQSTFDCPCALTMQATCCVCGGCTLEPVCSDKEPSGGVSCWQRKEWGSCSEQWMKDG
eukprot:scaffold65816_cov21-Tisochrysis_lutea.AAC.1